MQIDLFPVVVRFNEARKARARRIRLAEIEARRRVPLLARLFRRAR